MPIFRLSRTAVGLVWKKGLPVLRFSCAIGTQGHQLAILRPTALDPGLMRQCENDGMGWFVEGTWAMVGKGMILRLHSGQRRLNFNGDSRTMNMLGLTLESERSTASALLLSCKSRIVSSICALFYFSESQKWQRTRCNWTARASPVRFSSSNSLWSNEVFCRKMKLGWICIEIIEMKECHSWRGRAPHKRERGTLTKLDTSHMRRSLVKSFSFDSDTSLFSWKNKCSHFDEKEAQF